MTGRARTVGRSWLLAASGLLAWTLGPVPSARSDLDAASPTISMRGPAPAVLTVTPTVVRVTATSAFSPPSPDPSGITYDSARGRLVISDAEVEEMSIWAGRNIFETSLSGVLLRSYNVNSFTPEPTGAAFDANGGAVFFTDDDADRVFVVKPGPDGLIGTSDDTRTSFNTRDFGCEDPEGIAYDSVNRRLFIADGVGEEIYVLRPGANGIIDGAPPSGDDQVTHFDTGSFGATDPETVEYREDTGTVLVLGSVGPRVVKEVTTTGVLVSQFDLSSAPLDKPAGMAYAPTSNNPGGRSLYIVNRRVDNDSDPSENDGTMVEVAILTAATAADGSNAHRGPALLVASPNPARGRLGVEFDLADGPGTLELLDVTGRRAALHSVGALGPGRHRLMLGEALPAGVYFVRLTQESRTRTLRAMVLR